MTLFYINHHFFGHILGTKIQLYKLLLSFSKITETHKLLLHSFTFQWRKTFPEGDSQREEIYKRGLGVLLTDTLACRDQTCDLLCL